MQLALNKLHFEREDRALFTDLCANFSAGDIVQITGENGAGKTSLLRVIAGLCTQYQGEVLWHAGPDQAPVDHQHYDFRAALLYLGHAPGVNVSLSARENLRWFFSLCGYQKEQAGDTSLVSVVSDQAIVEALAQTGMRGYEDVACRYLSAGQQRRVALAKLFCSAAPLWILDEPFTAIDKAGVAALEARFQAQREAGGIILLTSHQNLQIEGLRTIDLSEYQGRERT